MTRVDTDHDNDLKNTKLWKPAVIDTEFSKRNIDIAALQKTQLARASTIKEAAYTFFWCGKLPEEPKLYGISFAIVNRLLYSCQTPYAVSERLYVLRVNTKQGDLLVLSAYAPILGADPDVKDLF